MTSEIENIIALLTRTFEKNAWHGPAVKEMLNDIPVEQSHSRFENTHSIIELVAHMTTWRIFVIHKLEGDENYEVDGEKNFPVGLDWLRTLADLDHSQAKLVRTLRHFPPDKLFEVVPHGSYSYTFYTLIHGLIHHDLYHLGQIALIKKTFS